LHGADGAVLVLSAGGGGAQLGGWSECGDCRDGSCGPESLAPFANLTFHVDKLTCHIGHGYGEELMPRVQPSMHDRLWWNRAEPRLFQTGSHAVRWRRAAF
jgi:hypothetical protein